MAESELDAAAEGSIADDPSAALQLFADQGAAGFFDLRLNGGKVHYSPAWKRMLGYDEAELEDSYETWHSLIHPEDSSAAPDRVRRKTPAGSTPFTVQFRMRHKDGHWVPILCVGVRIVGEGGAVERVTGIHVDGTDFLDASGNSRPPVAVVEQAPPAAAAPAASPLSGLQQAALATLAEAVIATDSSGRVLVANSAAERLLRLPPGGALNRTLSEVFRLVDRESGRPAADPVDRALSADGPLPLCAEHALEIEGAAPAPVVWTARGAYGANGKAEGVIIVFRDPDEMNLSPEELVRANRFESLGMVASGIAHDFNNLLTTILGGISLAKDARDSSALADSEKACLAAKGLTRQLLAFAKGGAAAQVACDPGEIMADALKIAAAGSAAEVMVAEGDPTAPVSVDHGQILQVFQNLVINALQAMPPPPHKPRVQIKAKNIRLKDGAVSGLAGGDYVEFEVRDNGSGIKPEHLARIWDPFFTTKKHGTGLGLATVLSIVRRHGGQIALESKLGVGTIFSVYLPASERPIEVQARRAPSLRFGTGRVLVMDDDEKIRTLTGTMLQGLDYKFDLARNGDEAITLYKRYLNIGRPYDVVLLDLTVIGGLGGEEAFKLLRELDPDIRAIVSSGYDNEEVARRFLDQGFCGYLTKPYRVADLGKVIKAVLG